MEKKPRKESILEKTAEVFDLPGDVVAGLPRVELLGDRQLRMENHRGILAYGSDEIHISGGKLIVIDGGFCKAYQPTTGIAGYTLIYNSWVLRIVSHEPFCGRKTAIEKNMDIANSSRVFERMDTRIKIAQTDIGAKLQAQADALRDLLSAYKAGAVPEDHRE